MAAVFYVALLSEDFFQLGEAGKGILLGQIRLTLNQGESIFNKAMGDAGSVLIDPLAGDLLFHIGHFH